LKINTELGREMRKAQRLELEARNMTRYGTKNPTKEQVKAHMKEQMRIR